MEQQTLRHGAASGGREEPSQSTMARVAAYLWAAGAGIVLVILALPHGPELDLAVAWGIFSVSAVCASNTYSLAGVGRNIDVLLDLIANLCRPSNVSIAGENIVVSGAGVIV